MQAADDFNQDCSFGITDFHMTQIYKGLEIFLGLSEAYAYIQLLESEGQIETRREKDMISARSKAGK